MSIQDWGAVGELIGSLAVLISLVYLAVQVRHVRKQARLDSELHLTDQMAKHTEQMGRDPESGSDSRIGEQHARATDRRRTS